MIARRGQIIGRSTLMHKTLPGNEAEAWARNQILMAVSLMKAR